MRPRSLRPLPTDAAGICRLFDLPWAEGAPVPVTYFTDIRCPSCRVLEGSLAGLARQEPDLFRLRTRGIPHSSARGPRPPPAPSAPRRGRARPRPCAASFARARPRTSPEGIAALAVTLDLDPGALVDAWQGPAVAESLAEDAPSRGVSVCAAPRVSWWETVVEGAAAPAGGPCSSSCGPNAGTALPAQCT